MKHDFTCSICNMPLDNYGYDADRLMTVGAVKFVVRMLYFQSK